MEEPRQAVRQPLFARISNESVIPGGEPESGERTLRSPGFPEKGEVCEAIFLERPIKRLVEALFRGNEGIVEKIRSLW